MLHQIKAPQFYSETVLNPSVNGKIQGLFKAILIFKNLSRQSCIFKYFSSLCEPCNGLSKHNIFNLKSTQCSYKCTQSLRQKINVSQALPHLFQMPLFCFSLDLNKKSGLIYFIYMSKSKYQHFYT